MNPLITDRLIIRKPNENDLQDFLIYRNDIESLKLQHIQPMSDDEAAQFIQTQMLINYEDGRGWIMFAIELINEQKMIGEVGIYIPAENHNTGDIGWSVNKDYHRKGYAIEAAQFLLKYAFGLRKLHQITATCDSSNVASLSLMRRLGMSQDDSYIHDEVGNEKHLHESRYTLSYEDWLAR